MLLVPIPGHEGPVDPAVDQGASDVAATNLADTGSFSTSTDDAVERTNVVRNERGDGTTTAAYKAPCNSSTSRSKKSKKRTKSRRSDVHSSGEIAVMIS